MVKIKYMLVHIFNVKSKNLTFLIISFQLQIIEKKTLKENKTSGYKYKTIESNQNLHQKHLNIPEILINIRSRENNYVQ